MNDVSDNRCSQSTYRIQYPEQFEYWDMINEQDS